MNMCFTATGGHTNHTSPGHTWRMHRRRSTSHLSGASWGLLAGFRERYLGVSTTKCPNQNGTNCGLQWVLEILPILFGDGDLVGAVNFEWTPLLLIDKFTPPCGPGCWMNSRVDTKYRNFLPPFGCYQGVTCSRQLVLPHDIFEMPSSSDMFWLLQRSGYQHFIHLQSMYYIEYINLATSSANIAPTVV